jgi:hypothetical protein
MQFILAYNFGKGNFVLVNKLRENYFKFMFLINKKISLTFSPIMGCSVFLSIL